MIQHSNAQARLIRIASLRAKWDDPYSIAKTLVLEGLYSPKNSDRDNVFAINQYIGLIKLLEKTLAITKP